MPFMSKKSKVVFVAFMQHCIQSTDLMLKRSKVYTGPLVPPRGKAIVGLTVHHQSVRGVNFVNFLGPVKLQG